MNDPYGIISTSLSSRTCHFWQIPRQQISDKYCKELIHPIRTESLPWNDPLTSIQLQALFDRRLSIQTTSLSHFQKLYYHFKPLFPRFLQIALRQAYRHSQEKQTALHWPIEDRYVTFQYELVKRLMGKMQATELPHIAFWPNGKRFAFVLTHDVETEDGFKAIPKLVELEKQYGFRSIFNIVPERYPIDRDYLAELQAEGFEIGIHGLKHDGKLFFSRRIFSERAKKINSYLMEYGVKGFRSPLTHRNPEWMQELEIEYDMSFFDTDPYETMPGGTMSIWPFFMGHFVELPYTLAQDHTLLVLLGETTPELWLRKIDFIEKYLGMALVIVHPDYMRRKEHLRVYAQFLEEMAKRDNYWHALPGEVARWWKERSQRELDKCQDIVETFLCQDIVEKLYYTS